jgi:L-aminopeptidase/D-esterase-like protein
MDRTAERVGSGQDLLPGETPRSAWRTHAQLAKEQANRIATVAHDALARAVLPAHTTYDGDTIFSLGTGTATASYNAVEVAAAEVVARAIAHGVRSADVR